MTMIDNVMRPGSGEYAPYYEQYIARVAGTGVLAEMQKGREGFISFVRAIPEGKMDYRYAEGKWTIREIVAHMIDTERVFVYRAMRFARKDQTALPGFDENEYAAASGAAARSTDSLLEEYAALRDSTIQFFKNITAEMSTRAGVASGREMSVRAVAYVITGHELHHMDVIRDRYLAK